MRTSTAYFAGVGTVIAAVAAGLGGGYLAANIAHPPVQAVSKLERRMSAEPIPSRRRQRSRCRMRALRRIRVRAGQRKRRKRSQSHSRQTEAAAPSANAAPSATSCARRREDGQHGGCGAARTAAAATGKIRRTGRRKNCQRLATPLRRHATPTSSAQTPKSAAPNGASAGPTSVTPATARAGARGGRGESPGRDRAEANQNQGRSRAERPVRRAGEHRNAADQAVRSGLIDPSGDRLPGA